MLWLLLLLVPFVVAAGIALRQADDLEIIERTIKIAGLPAAFAGLRLVHLTDLHGKTKFRGRALHQIVNGLRPDLVAITGDLASHPHELPAVIDELASCEGLRGRYFVPGNWEYAAHSDWATARRLLMEAGTVVLDNRGLSLVSGHSSLFLCGVDDPITGRANVTRALRYCSPGQVVVMLAHTHSFVSGIRDEVDLLLVGHTHGGQVLIPGYGHIRLSRRHRYSLVKGLHRLGRLQFYINKGIGTTKLPLRLGARPEIAVLTLQPVAEIAPSPKANGQSGLEKE
ncbi:MAG: metallophosphoesterase [Bacillota bacterium]